MKMIKFFVPFALLFTVIACQMANMELNPKSAPDPIIPEEMAAPDPIIPEDPPLPGAPSWKIVGQENFSTGSVWSPTMAVYNGELHIGYVDNFLKQIIVKKFNGAGWETVYEYNIKLEVRSLKFLANDSMLYLHFRNLESIEDTGFNIDRLKATFSYQVMASDGQKWENLNFPVSNEYPLNYLLTGAAVDKENLYISGDFPNSKYYTVYTYNGREWTSTDLREYKVHSLNSIAAYNGSAYITFEGSGGVFGSSGGLHAVECADKPITLGERHELSDAFRRPQTLDSAFKGHELCVAYDGTLNSKLSVKKFDRISWDYVGKANFSAGGVGYAMIAADQNTVYVAYEDNDHGKRLTVMKFNGSRWVPLGSSGFAKGQEDMTSLIVHEGIPYLAYGDKLKSGKITVVKFE